MKSIMVNQFAEYSEHDSSINRNKESNHRNQSFMQKNKQQSASTRTQESQIEITYSSTNECSFEECLKKIVQEHCK